jgi:2-keto-4-pentenoate hydratase/2-oxohepta-3-ene-1,7-dioic acid hydratase in catechol pathway
MDRYLTPGDVVELEIQPIGVLRTHVVSATRGGENADRHG